MHTAQRWLTYVALVALVLMPMACGSSGGDDGDSGTDAGTDDGGTDGGGDTMALAVDLVVVVDNSADMAGEAQSVAQNLNGLAADLEAAMLDWRIVLISKFGTTGADLCIPPPLGGAVCGGPSPTNTTQFFHYSTSIGSNDSLCRVLETFDTADEFNLTPTGWQAWVRPAALKAFLFVTTDGVTCTTAHPVTQVLTGLNDTADAPAAASFFWDALLTMSPAQFGTLQDPRMTAFGILGIVPKDMNDASVPYTGADLPVVAECPTANEPGTAYQILATNGDGWRFSICTPASYDSIFSAIAQHLVTLAGP